MARSAATARRAVRHAAATRRRVGWLAIIKITSCVRLGWPLWERPIRVAAGPPGGSGGEREDVVESGRGRGRRGVAGGGGTDCDAGKPGRSHRCLLLFMRFLHRHGMSGR
jgi:hypothetical protein